MLVEIGIQQISTDFVSFRHHTDSYIVREIYRADKNAEMPENLVEKFSDGITRKIKEQTIQEIPGAAQLIANLLFNSEYGVCFATGSLREAALYKLESINIEADQRLLVASDTIQEREKIVTQAIEQAQEVYNVERFERIISVGDGLWDLKTAELLGIEFVGVGTKHKELLKENGAQVVLDNLLSFPIK